MKTGFRTMGIAKDIPHQKRLWLIRHLITQGVTYEGLLEMNATKKEIEQAIRRKK